MNGTPVVATTAAAGHAGGPAVFSLACADLTRYLGDGDVLTVTSAAGALHLTDTATALRVDCGFASDTATLRRRLADGAVFDKFGRLTAGHRPARTAAVLDLVADVHAVLAGDGKVGVPCYGNLLGAVREHDVLAHDPGGFDLGYLSAETTAQRVREEFVAVCTALLAAGFDLRLERYSAMIRRRRTDEVFVDLNYLWADKGRLGLSYGWRGRQVSDLAAFTRYRDGVIADRVVTVPGNAEDVLAQLYGPGWPTPDQGFDHTVGLIRDTRYLLSDADLARIAAVNPDRVLIQADDDT